MSKMLVPLPWYGLAEDIIDPEVEWIKKLPKNTYCALWLRWPHWDRDCTDRKQLEPGRPVFPTNTHLPPGHDLYVVSFHLEALDVVWLHREAAKVNNAPIIVLSDNNYYDYELPANVKCYTYYYWHEQLKTMHEWHGIKQEKNHTHKYSAVCNRITQSKVYVTTKLLESARDDSLIIVNPGYLQLGNVHGWAPAGIPLLDSLTDIFREKYVTQHITIDNFINHRDNYQRFTSTPWQPLYQNAVINFTNESFHYSYMMTEGKIFTSPGPFITEKTLKCLLGATAFIPVGQFDTYQSLAKLGFNFEYGFDTTWDKDPGNLSRFSSTVNLIDKLNEHSITELDNITKDSSLFNQNHIASGKFYQTCEEHNQKIIEEILDLFA